MADDMLEIATPLTEDADKDASIRPLPRAAHFIFRGAEAAARQAGEVFGVTLPTAPCRAIRQADRAALWLGPDEWLLIAPAYQEASIEAEFATALADTPHAFVCVGHRDVAMSIEGFRVAEVLNAGCPLDLDEASFPIGMCTRTVLAKAEIILWRTGPQDFTIGVWRSFAPYVHDFLIEARTRL
jgi:sarcosine oxidase subunit gamma